MKISGIDEGFADIIDYLDSKGFRPYSSCDGVIDHHVDKEKPTKAYIAFLKSDRIIDVMAALLRDKLCFSVNLSSSTNIHPYELYGNMIEGNTYSVSFDNLQGQITEYFKKIVRGAADGKIIVTDAERERLTQIDECLEETKDSELGFSVELNCDYQPYTNKTGRTNRLTITTKEGVGYNRNMQELAQRISEKFGVSLKKAGFEDNYEDTDEFVVPQFDKCLLEYCFKDEDLPKALEIIKQAMLEEKSLETMEIKEPDYDEYDPLDY